MSEGMPQIGLKSRAVNLLTGMFPKCHMFCHVTPAVSAFRSASEFVLVELPLGPHSPASFFEKTRQNNWMWLYGITLPQ